MKKNKFLLIILLWGLFLGTLQSCSDDDKVHIGSPDVTFNNGSGEYKVKIGKEITLKAKIKDAVNPVYSWKINGEIVSTDTTFLFFGKQIGESFVNFRLDADNGSIEKQVKISVVEKALPVVSINGSLAPFAGIDYPIAPAVENSEGASYLWRVDGKVSGTDSVLIFNQPEAGEYQLALTVKNEDGEAVYINKVMVLSVIEAQLIFSDGRYRIPTDNRIPKFTVPQGRKLVLSPTTFGISPNAVYEWSVDGTVQNEKSVFFTFEPTQQKTYRLKVSVKEGGKTVFAEADITCTEPEETHRRTITASSSAKITDIFEYIPAPNQFNSYQIGSTFTQALNDARSILTNESYTFLGAYGGYIVMGFDHSVENKEGEYDLEINGNAFSGNSEPAIVWVMQDENGDGLPNDTWYELKGSAIPEQTTRQYDITYYKPKETRTNVIWVDNEGKTGSVDINSYHSQDYYFPMFIQGNSYTLYGTKLAPLTENVGGIWYNRDYEWGYVDNYGTNKDCFDIGNAVQRDGTPIKLKYIDFVMVQTGISSKAENIGELSTECCAAYDYHLKNK